MGSSRWLEKLNQGELFFQKISCDMNCLDKYEFHKESANSTWFTCILPSICLFTYVAPDNLNMAFGIKIIDILTEVCMAGWEVALVA